MPEIIRLVRETFDGEREVEDLPVELAVLALLYDEDNGRIYCRGHVYNFGLSDIDLRRWDMSC